VFTASENEADVTSAYALEAKDLVHKPMLCGMVQKWAATKENDDAIC
jgi:hypothetical protein